MIDGVATLMGGLQELLGRSELRHVLWRMLVLLVVLMLLLMGGIFTLTDYLANLWLPEGDAWYWQVISFFVWIIAILLAAFTGVVSFTALGSAAAAPWLDELAARTEAAHGMAGEASGKSWPRQIMEAIANSIRPLGGLLTLGVLALLLMLIPVIGQIAAAAVWGYAGIRFLNFELMDTVASRRGWGFARRKQTLNERRLFWFGFGGLAMAMMLVPFVNLLVIPAAVVGLTKDDARG